MPDDHCLTRPGLQQFGVILGHSYAESSPCVEFVTCSMTVGTTAAIATTGFVNPTKAVKHRQIVAERHAHVLFHSTPGRTGQIERCLYRPDIIVQNGDIYCIGCYCVTTTGCEPQVWPGDSHCVVRTVTDIATRCPVAIR